MHWLSLFVLYFLLTTSVFGDKLVILVLDGFRWDYHLRVPETKVPAFTQLRNQGVTAEYVQPIFPSNSFASWTSIATGLYAESHGILDNYMYNADTGLEFNLLSVQIPGIDHTNDPVWWKDHTPIWISTSKAGFRTSVYHFSRCDVPFDGTLPEKCVPYNNVDTVTLSEFKSNLNDAMTDLLNGFDVTIVYTCHVDEMGHLHGPNSPEVYDAVKSADQLIKEFLDDLEQSGLKPLTNVVVVSDHGMTDKYNREGHKLTDFTPQSDLEKVIDNGAMTNIKVAEGVSVDAVMANLSRFPGVTFYKKEDIPDHMHYKNNDLIYDILMVTQGTELVAGDTNYPENYLPPPTLGLADPGSHGWDDTSPDYNSKGSFPDMRTIFLASGPAFKRNHKMPWIRLVDEYQIFLKVLGLQGMPHNGTWSRVQDMFVEPTSAANGIQSSKDVLKCGLMILLIVLKLI